MEVKKEKKRCGKRWVIKQAFLSLFKNDIQEEVKLKINKLKLPNRLNLLSNAHIHIIEGIIKQNANNLKDTIKANN